MVTQERPAVEEIEGLRVASALNRARDIEHYVEKMLMQEGPISLSTAQGRILCLVEAEPGITPSELGKWLHQRIHSISGLLNRLEDAGMIIRTRDRVDRRVVHVMLEPRGQQAVAFVRKCFARAEVEFS